VYGALTTVDDTMTRIDVQRDCAESARYILAGFLAGNTQGNADNILMIVVKKLAEKCFDAVVDVSALPIPACMPRVVTFPVPIGVPVVPPCQDELLALNAASIAERRANGEKLLAALEVESMAELVIARESHLQDVQRILIEEC
jgi:hypothetical protein